MLTTKSVDSILKKGATGMTVDGQIRGLYLKVTGPKRGSWVFRYKSRTTGKTRYMGLGTTSEVKLAEARRQATDLRGLMRRGLDPLDERDRIRQERQTEAAKAVTFSDAAAAYIAAHEAKWRSDKHAQQWRNTIERYAAPTIGKVPVANIELAHISKVLEPIWHSRTETASRLRGRIERILDWCKVKGYRDSSVPNPAAWTGNLEHVYPSPREIMKVKHHAAVDLKSMHDFMVKLRERDGMAARALEFLIYTAARSGEVRGAEWSEINRDLRLWTVPEGRMKAGRAWMSPLSESALRLLDDLPKGAKAIFPNSNGKQLSSTAIEKICKAVCADLEIPPATPHGMRSCFKDWARTFSSQPDEVSELQLAHVNSDATRAAYARDMLIPRRGKLLEAWASWLDKPYPKEAEVLTLGTKSQAS